MFQLKVYSAFLTGATIITNNSSEAALLVTVCVLFVKRDYELIAPLLPHADLKCTKKNFMMSIMVCDVY